MKPPPGKFSEFRLIMHCYPEHTTVALVTRDRRGSENWDRRHHAWNLALPQSDYDDLSVSDQLWVILGALALATGPVRRAPSAKPPEPPVGGYRGLQDTLPGLGADLDKRATLKTGPSPLERSGAQRLR